MTNSAAPGGASSSYRGGDAHYGSAADPVAGVSSCVPSFTDAGGTHEHRLACTPDSPSTARRWDYAYQFLLQLAMEHTAGNRPAPSPLQEESHGSRSLHACLDQSSATAADDGATTQPPARLRGAPTGWAWCRRAPLSR